MNELEDLLKQEFNFQNPEIKILAGYFNLNYSIVDSGKKSILKTYPFEAEYADILEAENEVLLQLSAHINSGIPKPIPFQKGQFLLKKELSGKPSMFRLLSFLEGEFLGSIPPSKTTYKSLGSFLADLDLGLKECKSYVLRSRQLDWDIQYLQLNKPLIESIPSAQDRSLVRYFFLQFEENVVPIMHQLRKQLIHGDANEWNILTKDGEVTGIIDFGDCTYSPLINEVAIALTYIIYDKEKPLDWVTDFLKAYHQKLPLEAQELEILYYLIAARLCISVCQSAQARKVDPENSYATISEKAAWATLRKWIAISPLGASNIFKKAVNLPVSEFIPIEAQLERRYQSISPILSVSYKNPIAITSAAFQYMYDDRGNAILDAYNNIPHVGHSHPTVVAAGQRQMAKLNTNTRYLYDSLAEYAEKLLAKFPPSLSKVYFVNSGSAASDLAMRIATAHTKSQNYMVMEHGYHGNTQISIDISDYKFSNKKGIGQKPNILKAAIPDTYLGKYKKDDGSAGEAYAKDAIAQLEEFDGKIAAFIAEPIIGCGGQVPLAKGYLQALYPAIRNQGGICISDEVQTGFGRVGTHFWGYEVQGVIPDMVVLGKPMGNGHPMGAVVCTEEIADSFSKGVEFFSSFGGNPVSCEIGIAVLEAIEEENLQENARIVGKYYFELFKELQKNHSCIGDVRGSGLFLGVELVKSGTTNPDTALASRIKNELRNRNILISTDGPHDNVLKTKPPLCFSKENAAEVVRNIEDILNKIA
ncbi:aminotransferase class III-fold pyridoxal phosphate-dependent enzyme [Algoriphagus marinus]|uniref:aminotransferase class III-fold pyridoxal phosphate-dependent enzyme n=1 Tax=Algoriphagus marinus TaxID=1925762 RepID=UPI00094BBF1F|nr:aminotransferase class III-fold pyridoxal phosphate-dependent enzyme [Algoriphagus marinus]